MRRIFVHLRRLVHCFLLFLIIPFISFGQSPTGTISGLILDPAGRAVPEAEILVVHDLTGVQYATKTTVRLGRTPPGKGPGYSMFW